MNAYLYGNKKERMNLDSKKDSVNFHPHLFEQILQPKNYPLGRFPSNTTYALSLMQQVAVNLSIGFDNNQMRSVNGPPGTGKTTLLKDIFAQLVVQQAYSIAKLSDHFIKGTEKTIYLIMHRLERSRNILSKIISWLQVRIMVRFKTL